MLFGAADLIGFSELAFFAGDFALGRTATFAGGLALGGAFLTGFVGGADLRFLILGLAFPVGMANLSERGTDETNLQRYCNAPRPNGKHLNALFCG